MHVAVDQWLAAAFALRDHQLGRYALANQIGADGLRPLFRNLQVALAVTQLVGVPRDDDLADIRGVQQLAGNCAQLMLAFVFRLWKSARPKANRVSDSSVMVSIARSDWARRLSM